MKNSAVEIGQRIRNYRLQIKLSQEELAERCGLHPTYIGQVERGEKNATIESIGKISSGLGIPLSRLFENLDISNDIKTNYPAQAYALVQSLDLNDQKKLVGILREIIEFR